MNQLTDVKNKNSLLWQIILFGLVGGTTLLIDVISSSAFYYIFHFPAYISSGAGFIIGFLFSFPMNRKRVFHHSDKDRFSLKFQVLLYILLSLANLVITSLLVDLLVTQHVTSIQIAKIIMTGLIAIWNFLIFKFFVFSKK